MPLTYTLTKITREEFKKMEELNITYGTADSKYGKCLMGLQEDRFCFVHFGDPDASFQALKKSFPKANFRLSDSLVREKIQLFDSDASGEIKLLLIGTKFELDVWEQLISIPNGKTTCYEEIAKNINLPKAVRAVANAIGRNNIAYFIPCHRVISKNGNINKFKWGIDVKNRMLQNEKKIAKRKFLELFLKKHSSTSLKKAKLDNKFIN